MRKIFYLLALFLVILSCKKNDDPDPKDDGGNNGGTTVEDTVYQIAVYATDGGSFFTNAAVNLYAESDATFSSPLMTWDTIRFVTAGYYSGYPYRLNVRLKGVPNTGNYRLRATFNNNLSPSDANYKSGSFGGAIEDMSAVWETTGDYDTNTSYIYYHTSPPKFDSQSD
jgi:hypothetical protein